MYYLPLYITVFVIALILTAILEYKLIPVLKGKAQQPIYTDGPAWHVSKSGTPTMGGIAFVIASALAIGLAIAVIALTDEVKTAASILLTLCFSLSNAIIGIIDDSTKLRRKENAGLSPKQKLLLQLLLAVVFIILRHTLFNDGTALRFSFGEIELGLFYYPFALLMLLGIINCANLTDGVDGLAACTGLTVGGVLLIMSFFVFTDVTVASLVLMAVCLGFVFFNRHPAKIFMGDTGSLFLGALAVSSAFSLGNPAIMIFVGGVYVVEGISVILQVVCYKTSGKRIFKMAPLHHHLEQCGISENKICVIAIIATVIFSLPAFLLFQR